MISNSFKISIALLVVIGSLTNTNGFTLSPNPALTVKYSPIQTPTTLSAKKKKNRKSGGKGFGKAPEVEPTTPNTFSTPSTPPNTPRGTPPPVSGLSSIENTTPESFSRPELDIDPNLSQDERNKEILKQQFGLRSFEEKQGDIKAAEKMAENRDRMKKIKQMKDEDFDIFMVIPPPLIKAIDAFLKLGLAVCTVLFVLSGVGITAEAWAVASGNALPENVDSFIVNVIEPNFTPGLLVLLGFSVTLGVFATAQLGSGSSVYKE